MLGLFGCEKYVQKRDRYVDLSAVCENVDWILQFLGMVRSGGVYEHGAERLVSVRGVGLLIELRISICTVSLLLELPVPPYVILLSAHSTTSNVYCSWCVIFYVTACCHWM